MPITSLIDKRDNSEIIRDKIAEILFTESASQQELARQASKNPFLWALRVYTERSDPWSDFQTQPDSDENPERAPLIVNVSFNDDAFDKAASDLVERQKATGTFHIDIYGYGESGDAGVGHTRGDSNASLDAQRGARLVRNILMSAEHYYLGLRGLVHARWIDSITQYQPTYDGRLPIDRVVGMRISLQVDFSEFAPQVTGQPFEGVNVTIKRRGDGLIYLVASFPEASP